MKLNRIYSMFSPLSSNVRSVFSQLLLLTCALMFNMSPVRGQEPPPPAEDATLEFVSGTVVELSQSRIVVHRVVLGKPGEDRAFVMRSETKVEGRLRRGARVTVGFRMTDEGDVAMRVIVRS